MISLLTMILALHSTANAQQGSNHCGYYPEPIGARGACGDRTLPSDKVRNLRNIRLECGSGVDHYIRTFVPFNIDEWKSHENDRNAMQKMRLAEKKIAWSASIPYETTEMWEWTDCVYGQDPVCGTHEECHNETRTVKDSDGKESEVTERVCVDVMNSCHHDEDESESRFCSTERMDFNASFNKPESSWKPGAQGYYDVIPNKYDLLPGEVEDVQFFANSRRSTSVTPSLEVGDAWNNYSPRITISETGSGSAACRYNQPLHATVAIQTTGRIFGKNTPNAFRLPVREDGKKVSPLKWVGAMDSATRWKPREIELMDVSHTMITAMARQTRKFEMSREIAKSENGKGATQTPKEYIANKAKATQSGFFKNTEVRVRLKQITGMLSRNIRPTHNLYTNGSESSMEGYYSLLLTGGSSTTDLYRASGPISDSWWDWKNVELKPKRKYQLLVSMYQEGVPFYKQAKGDDKDSAFSKELEIDFKTENADQRDMLQKLLDFQGGS